MVWVGGWGHLRHQHLNQTSEETFWIWQLFHLSSSWEAGPVKRQLAQWKLDVTTWVSFVHLPYCCYLHDVSQLSDSLTYTAILLQFLNKTAVTGAESEEGYRHAPNGAKVKCVTPPGSDVCVSTTSLQKFKAHCSDLHFIFQLCLFSETGIREIKTKTTFFFFKPQAKLLVQIITASQRAVWAQLNWAVDPCTKAEMSSPGQRRIKATFGWFCDDGKSSCAKA